MELTSAQRLGLYGPRAQWAAQPHIQGPKTPQLLIGRFPHPPPPNSYPILPPPTVPDQVPLSTPNLPTHTPTSCPTPPTPPLHPTLFSFHFCFCNSHLMPKTESRRVYSSSLQSAIERKVVEPEPETARGQLDAPHLRRKKEKKQAHPRRLFSCS